MTVSVVLARALVDLVERRGIERQAFLDAASLSQARLEQSDARLELEEYEALIALALDMTGDPALGLRLYDAATPANYSVIAHLITGARTLRDGIELLQRFYRLVWDQPPWRLVEEERIAKLVCDECPGSERIRRFRTEMTVSGLYRMVRAFTLDVLPSFVAFTYSPPEYRGDYARAFDGLERFGQRITAIVLPRELLDLTQPYHDPELLAAVESQAEKRVARLADARTFADRVREHLVENTGEQRLDMPAVARALAVSPRTLRRRLQEEGVSFRDLVDGALETLAKRLLADERRAIKDVASTLGFADNAAFGRAFRRWAGTTPKQYRIKTGSVPPPRKPTSETDD
jgi:AraC-like DNA-binding protein